MVRRTIAPVFLSKAAFLAHHQFAEGTCRRAQNALHVRASWQSGCPRPSTRPNEVVARAACKSCCVKLPHSLKSLCPPNNSESTYYTRSVVWSKVSKRKRQQPSKGAVQEKKPGFWVKIWPMLALIAFIVILLLGFFEIYTRPWCVKGFWGTGTTRSPGKFNCTEREKELTEKQSQPPVLPKSEPVPEQKPAEIELPKYSIEKN